MKHIKTTLVEYIKESMINLEEIFGEYPEESEYIWNYISPMEYDSLFFEIKQMEIGDLATSDFVENFNDNAQMWQRKLVLDMVKNIDQIKDKPIVYDPIERLVVDGNHKLMAMYIAGIKCVNIIDITQ